MLKFYINTLVRLFGYQFVKKQTLSYLINTNHFKWFRDLQIKTIIDIGANEGQFALAMNNGIPDATFYSFEPLKECFDALKKNTTNIKHIEYFNYALGEVEDEQIINHNEYSPSSSFLKMGDLHKSVFPNTSNTIMEKIKIKSLDSFYGKILFEKKVLLKIDVQGYELNVLKGAKKILKKTDIIIIETSFFSLYEGQPLFHDIYEYLISENFSYYGNFEQLANPHDGQILQADAIFLKNS